MAENGEINVSTPLGSVSAKGKHICIFLALAGSCLLVLVAYALWDHKNDAKESSALLASAIREMTVAQRQNVEAQREMNCLIAMPQDKREREYMVPNSLCKRLAQER